MKSNPKNNQNHSRGAANGRSALYLLFRGLVHLSLLTAALLLYLWVIGLPAPMTRDLIARLDTGNYRIAVQRIRFDPLEGVVADRPQLLRPNDPGVPVMQAHRAALGVNFIDWLKGRPCLRSLRVRNAALFLPPKNSRNRHTLVVTNLYTDIKIEPQTLELKNINGYIHGITVEGDGIIYRPTAEVTPALTFFDQLDKFMTSLESAPAWVRARLDDLERATYQRPPLARLVFQIHPDAPERSDMVLQVVSGRAQFRGALLDAMDIQAHWRANRIFIPELKASVGDRSALASGVLDLRSWNIEAHLFSDLPPAVLLRLAPDLWREQLDRRGISLLNSLRGELWLGPVPLAEAGRHFHGWFEIEHADVNGFWIERAAVKFERDNTILRLDDISAIVGRDAGQGPAAGSFRYDMASGEYDGGGRFNFRPGEALPILTSNQARVIRFFAFHESPPSFEGLFSGRTGPNPDFKVVGRLEARDFMYRGVPVVSLETGIDYADHILTLSPFSFTRTEGGVDGELRMEFRRALYIVNLDGTINPKAAARMVSPQMEQALRGARFEGPVHLLIEGSVDAAMSRDATRLLLHVDGQDAGFRHFMTERIGGELILEGPMLYSTNISGRAYGGPFLAKFLVYPQPGLAERRYEIEVRAKELDFSGIIHDLRSTDDGINRGKLSLFVQLTGLAGEDLWYTAEGVGRAAIKEGQLFQIPLLGGLSQFLSMIVPGFGYLSQTDFNASFMVRDGAVRTRDAMLEGSLLSVKGKGTYRFDGRLGFDVEVQLLRKGRVASALRFLTAPVTKLLKFNLGGTYQEPKWRPVNLPKEMFLIFD